MLLSPSHPKIPRWTFVVLALFFAAAGVFHLAAAIQPSLGPNVPTWRHALFVAINLLCVAGFLHRPRFFVYLFAALVIEQLISHGGDAWRAWHDEERIDYMSFGVLLMMPLAFALLVIDARARPR